MKKTYKTMAVLGFSMLMILFVPSVITPSNGISLVAATSSKDQICEGAGGKPTKASGTEGQAGYVPAGCDSGDKLTVVGIFKKVLNILLFLVGAVSVIMIIVGGLRYTISAGDQSAVSAAKNTILYAVIGLVIAFIGGAAVNFIVSSL